MSSKRLSVVDLGRMSFGQALEIQQRTVERRMAEEIADTLILVEHPPVITLGRGAKEEDIVVPRELLEKNGVEVHRITRGGLVTYHGPGQLVGYPIVHLYERARELKRFVTELESVFVDMLEDRYHIRAELHPDDRGVWVEGARKITAVGIAVQRRITMHGFAFNVEPDLSHFRWIVPCGISDRGVTSLATELGRSVTLEEVRSPVVESFAERFGYTELSGRF